VRQVISADVARELRRMMVQAVERETQLARVPGYTVGGKTGTAQIPIPGGYHPTDTIASFIGFLPDENPEICILVKVDRPKASPWGSQVAAPIFSKVARDLVLVLGIAPQSPASAEAKQ
jgi:cell division protein FtsI/penicillin-binding protein 2